MKINKHKLKLDNVYQVFFVIFKNSNAFKYLDLLEQLGEYKLVVSNKAINNKIVQEQLAYINTNKKSDELVELFNQYKSDKETIVIVGMTLDMMLSLKDEDVKNWCLSKQEKNMKYILEATQQENLREFSKILSLLNQEIDKLEQDETDENDKRKGNVE